LFHSLLPYEFFVSDLAASQCSQCYYVNLMRQFSQIQDTATCTDIWTDLDHERQRISETMKHYI
jgi:hypothetical protein